MAPNLISGEFKIVSLIEGNPPVGVNLTAPAFQSVYLNPRVKTWVARKEGPDTYRLSVGGYHYTGIIDKRVTASIHQDHNVEWLATYRKHQDAYTIEPVNDPGNGWTVPRDSEAGSHAVIEIELIIIRHVEPPQYSTSQLFRFVPVLE